MIKIKNYPFYKEYGNKNFNPIMNNKLIILNL